MAGTATCPRCGSELSPGTSPEGLCPRCLLEEGLAGGSTIGVALSKKDGGEAPATRGGFVPPEPSQLAGLFPGLEILELLGQGGMGAVYKARQTRLNRLVALKVLPQRAGADSAFAERFSREARALASLSHSNIVTIHDFGQSGALYYFIMELVDGLDLRRMMKSGNLGPREALSIVPQVCDALQYAHNEGIVHRDIKPENILIDRKGRVKIADFGLAKLVGRAGSDLNLTGPLHVMGTPLYMAPEQMAASRDVDHRADIYSLGVVFYEMLTGELPVGRFALPSQKVNVDVRLDEVVLKTLEREPRLRYQQVSELKSEMESIGGGGGPAAKAGPEAAGASPAWRLALMAASVLILFLGGLWAWREVDRRPPAAPSPANSADLGPLLERVLDPLAPHGEKEKGWGKIHATGLLDLAIEEVERRSRESPRDPHLKTQMGNAYLKKLIHARSDEEKGTLAYKVDQAFDAALAIDEKHLEARITKALSLSYWPAIFGKQPEAIRHLETALLHLEADPVPRPEFSEAFLFLGNLYLQQGNRARAAETWKRGLARFPESTEFLEQLKGLEATE